MIPIPFLKMLEKVTQTANKILRTTFSRFYTSGRPSLSDRWQTDKNIIMNTFARRKVISDRYGVTNKSDDCPITHVSMNPPRKFHVPRVDNEIFLQKYTRGIIDHQYMTLLELPTVYSPLRVDVDVEKMDSSVDVVTEKLIEQIMSLYAEESLKYLADPTSLKTQGLLTAYVMQRKKNYMVDSETKDGLHAIFPDAVFPSNLHNSLFHIPIAEVVENMTSGEGKFKILVDQIGKNPWFMLGSQKHCDLYPYTVEYVWKYGEKLTPFTLNMNSESEVFHWVSKFSIRHKEPSEYCVEASDDLKNEILSIEESGEEELNVLNASKSKASSQFQSYVKSDYGKLRRQQKFCDKTMNKLIIDLGNLLDLYDVEISDTYKSWSSIGFALKILCESCDECENEFKELWFSFSEKSAKFNPSECEKTWNSLDSSKGDVLFAKRILLKYANECDISAKYKTFLTHL